MIVDCWLLSFNLSLFQSFYVYFLSSFLHLENFLAQFLRRCPLWSVAALKFVPVSASRGQKRATWAPGAQFVWHSTSDTYLLRIVSTGTSSVKVIVHTGSKTAVCRRRRTGTPWQSVNWSRKRWHAWTLKTAASRWVKSWSSGRACLKRSVQQRHLHSWNCWFVYLLWFFFLIQNLLIENFKCNKYAIFVQHCRSMKYTWKWNIKDNQKKKKIAK